MGIDFLSRFLEIGKKPYGRGKFLELILTKK